MNPIPKQIVVIGGGISGLAAAHRLMELRAESNSQFEVVLLESSSRLGGSLQTIERDGFLLEGGADSFISEKPEAIRLSERLGISSRMIETNTEHRRSFIVRNGRLRPVPEGFHLLAPTRFWPFVTTKIFSWPGKARMALDLVIPARAGNGSNDESLAQFVRRRLGREALERMAQPMVGGIYTSDPEKLSLRATLPRFLEMERTHGSVIRAMWKQRQNQSHGVSGARYSLFLSFDRGMEVLIRELSTRLQSVARLNTRVEALTFDEALSKWSIRLSDNTIVGADQICLAIPAYAAAKLLVDTDEQLARLLQKIEFASTATINLAYRRADVPHLLDGFGFVVPYIERRSILACTFSSVKFAGRAPADHVLLRAFVGGALQPEMFELDETEMLRRTCADLRDLLGITSPPRFSEVEKWRQSMPQYHLAHLEVLSQIEQHVRSLTRLQLAGNSYGGAGIPDCIRSGETAADKLHAAISS
jgi:protoporphyrinogen/coproporphyrinogen III oxidase